MPRTGFKLYRRPNSPYWWVYFWCNGVQRVSTGILLAEQSRATQRAAEIVSEAFARAAATPPPGIAEQLGLEALADAYLDELRARSPEVAERHATDIGYIKQLWSSPQAITSDSWVLAKAALRQNKTRLGKPMSWRSIGKVAGTLRAFLQFCQQRGAIKSLPEIRLTKQESKAIRVERAPRRALDEGEVGRFLAELGKIDGRACRIYTVLFETWMRKGSLEAMTPRWIDWKRETITIPAAHFKTRHEKMIDLTPTAALVIRAELASRNVVNPDEPIFGAFDFHGNGHCDGIFQRACRAAGIDMHGLTPHHSTRHSAASIAGGKPGASLSALMSQAGWDTPSVAQGYLHTSIEDARRVTRQK